MVANLENFNSAALDPKGSYIAVANFYSKQGTALGKDNSGGLAKMADNYHSGISDEDFYALIDDFAQRHNIEVILMDDGAAVLEARPESYKLIQEECGDRFSYMLGAAAMVDAFTKHMLGERERAVIMEELYEEEMHDSPHLDA